jgi:hypothetical protein
MSVITETDKQSAKIASGVPERWLPSLNEAAQEIVRILLGEASMTECGLTEASVHLPTRSRVWVAAFTGPAGGQIWRSTGLTDRDQALLVARKWEAEARAERAKLGRTARKPVIRVRRLDGRSGVGPLTQQEVATLMGLSVRAVREIEHRALRKIRDHPLMRKAWQQYLAGELDEHQPTLTHDEVEALFNLTRTPEERHLIEKVLSLIQA